MSGERATSRPDDPQTNAIPLQNQRPAVAHMNRLEITAHAFGSACAGRAVVGQRLRFQLGDSEIAGNRGRVPTAENQQIAVVVKRFCELYKQHRGASYLFRRGKDVPLVTLLLGTYTAAQIEQMAMLLLTTTDEWIAGTDRGIGILTVKASWLANMLAQQAQRTPKELPDCAACENSRWVQVLKDDVRRVERCDCWRRVYRGVAT